MIESIKNAVQTIVSFFQAVWDFITNIVDNTVKGVKFLIMSIDNLTASVDFLPPVLKIFGLITVTIVVILFITNRNGGKSSARS